MRDYREPEDKNLFGYHFQWMDIIVILTIIGIVMCALWAMKADADEADLDSEVYYPPEFFITHADAMEMCFNEALKVASTIEFETHEDYLDAVSALTGGCMYYQMLEQSTCQQTPFAYPIEPDGSPSEFDHQF